MTIVADVLQSCNQDFNKAYAILLEMVIPPDTDCNITPTAPSEPTNQTLSHAPYVQGETSFPEPTKPEPRYEPPRSEEPPQSSVRPSAPLQGAWIRNIGHQIRIESMCKKYAWMPQSEVKDLFEKNFGCVDLVEQDILKKFPIDEPQAFRDHTTPNDEQRPHQCSKQTSDATVNSWQTASEANRPKQLQVDPDILQDMFAARERLWNTREEYSRLQTISSQTGNSVHADAASKKGAELTQLSEEYLAAIRASDSYRHGVIDLHGLTREEAIKLVQHILTERSSTKFRLITGRGSHSHGHRGVLGPALEKYFRDNGVAFTQSDGVLTVTSRQ